MELMIPHVLSWGNLATQEPFMCLLRIGTYRGVLSLKGARLTMRALSRKGDLLTMRLNAHYDLCDPESLPRLVKELKTNKKCMKPLK